MAGEAGVGGVPTAHKIAYLLNHLNRAKNFESNKYRIAHYLNRNTKCPDRIVRVCECYSNRDWIEWRFLILPITGHQLLILAEKLISMLYWYSWVNSATAVKFLVIIERRPTRSRVSQQSNAHLAMHHTCCCAQRLYWYKCVRLSRLLAFECTLNHCTFIHSSWQHNLSPTSRGVGLQYSNVYDSLQSQRMWNNTCRQSCLSDCWC